jgi:hypothetical protein
MLEVVPQLRLPARPACYRCRHKAFQWNDYGRCLIFVNIDLPYLMNLLQIFTATPKTRYNRLVTLVIAEMGRVASLVLCPIPTMLLSVRLVQGKFPASPSMHISTT